MSTMAMYASGLANFNPEDWANVGNTFKVMILNTSYVFDSNDQFVSDVSAFEVSGTGYVAGFAGSGRHEITSRTSTWDGSIYEVLDGDDPADWTGLDVGALGGIIIFLNGTSDADSELVCFNNDGFPQTPVAQTFRIPWSADGIMRLRNEPVP